MPVLRILVQALQCAQKKVLFLTSSDDFRLAGTITRTLTEGKIPGLDHAPGTHGAAAVQELDAATAREGISA